MAMLRFQAVLSAVLLLGQSVTAADPAAPISAPPDLIFHHGHVLTVDPGFRAVEAMAVRGERIVAVGTDDEIRKLAGKETKLVDLAGKTVLPGLIDTHTHTPDAAIFEFDHPVPNMETVADVLAYVKSRAAALKKGEWIRVQQVFITRLREQRFPTRQELDEAAPGHPVVFRTGPDASLNSLALKLSGIDKEFKIADGKPGRIERDPATGEPTGILRNCARFIKYRSPEKSPTADDRRECLGKMLAAYNAVGITGVVDRGASDDTIALYRQLKDRGQLNCRIFLTYYVDAQGSMEKLAAGVRHAAAHPLHKYDNRLWLRGLKIYLDGGMLNGTAFMRRRKA